MFRSLAHHSVIEIAWGFVFVMQDTSMERKASALRIIDAQLTNFIQAVESVFVFLDFIEILLDHASGAKMGLFGMEQLVFLCVESMKITTKFYRSANAKPDMEKLNGICSMCALPYFLKNGYCVTCPINAEYSSQ